MPETFKVGLLGHGTVGAAFEALLGERADAIEPITGARPEIAGVLTRSRGSFEEILEGSDLIVELMGGLEPARDYVLRAMRAGKHVVSANKQLLSTHGEELWATAREHGVQLRFEGAVAGVVPVIRVLQESLAAARIERVHGIVNGTTNYILTEMAANGHQLRAGARPGAVARLRRGRPDRRRHRPRRRGQDGDPRPAGVLDAGPPRPGPLRGHRADHRRRHGLRARPRPRAQADRHRRARRRRAQRPRAPRLPLRRAPAGVGQRAVQRRHDRVRRDHRGHAVGPRRRRPADRERGPGRRHLGDDPARHDAGDDRSSWRSSRTSSRPSTSTSRSPTARACSPRSPRSSACRARR